MDKQLQDLTVVELKAIAYDQMAQMELLQNNLRVINQELARRLNTSPPQPNMPINPLPPGSIQPV